jgi:hypothetical protein
MKRHLDKVIEIAKKYDYEVMVWSDMYFRSWNNGVARIPKCVMPQEIINSVPKDAIPVYWDYYHEKREEYDAMLYNHEQLSKNTWFAGGIWTWRGFLPCNTYSLNTMIPAIDECHAHKVDNVFFTMWGDNGGECSRYSVLPSLFYLAEYARGNKDAAAIKAKFEKRFGLSFEDFMLFEKLNVAYKNSKDHRADPKAVLFSDYFFNFRDVDHLEDYAAVAAETAKQLHAVAKKSRRFGYLFDSAAGLCDVFAVKYDLGVKTRAAYKAGDKTELARLANEEYTAAYRLIGKFAAAFEKQWMKENKAAGFEVQHIRLGGLLMRTAACRRRLLDFAKGNIDRIEELEGELLPLNQNNASSSYNNISSIGLL